MALHPNWSRYTTDDGKEYYHNSVTDKTQWEKPEWTEGEPSLLSFHSQTSEVYRPTSSDLELHDRLSDPDGNVVGIASSDFVIGQEARGGKLPTTDAETVSLSQAPPRNFANEGFSSTSAGSRAPSTGNSLPSGVLGFGGLLYSAASGSEEGTARVSSLAGWALDSAQQLFDVSSDDVLKRLRLSVTPMQAPLDPSSNDFRLRPDFWGPFWIATTAALFLAATGNFARLLSSSDSAQFKADYSLLSVAASMIYGFLVGVPIITRIGLYFSGHEVDTINFRQVICVYGYSLSSTIPVSILCIVPSSGLRWIFVLIGFLVSLAFIRGALWTDIAIEAPSLKWKLVGLFVVAQATIFLTYRLQFFSAITV